MPALARSRRKVRAASSLLATISLLITALMSAPGSTSTSNRPPRGRRLAWERPGARPAESIDRSISSLLLLLTRVEDPVLGAPERDCRERHDQGKHHP